MPPQQIPGLSPACLGTEESARRLAQIPDTAKELLASEGGHH